MITPSPSIARQPRLEGPAPEAGSAPGTGTAARWRLLAVLAAQTLLLWAVSALGSLAVADARLPVPGNLVGLVVMFALLSARIVPLRWVEPAASMLLRHLPLFFMPIAAGVMTFGSLMSAEGPGIAACLIFSAAVGFAVCGRVCQALAGPAAPATAAGHGHDCDANRP